MKIDLTGQTALVSASTSGIGRAIAVGLAGAGADIVVNGRRPEVTEKVVTELSELFPEAKVTGIVGDLAKKEDIDRLTAEVPKVDILVNNLGIYDDGDFFTVPDDEWLRFFDTNVMSGIRLSRFYMPGMLERNYGRLIFISSESGVTTRAERLPYSVTKTAILAVARGLAETARGTAVTSNSIVVGTTLTEAVAGGVEQLAQAKGISFDEAQREVIAEHRPTHLLPHLLSMEEVANMVVYVASPQASATTGSALRVDGGGITTIL
ncbi:NAD(P)-dependent dehydrogenase (short-subunit alcohol dehydrogenase family) [Sphingobium xenophagum]|uniref:NAD(P)-dependent dehydrogenase (Short-subunit alcohol dehydrogenase family) n=1 Tax=Sphingobium xenophagum TaxID=121428 RepID=A0ABU1X5S9_SPHXE|nr:SDR family oxidoreductase [Sphingobium xenophagum]MDR7156502.1 NAD(P)-dependent dehydrogenase (short-subunit alcohol dehydrogenase family) [Sphingobium xenophagum]